MAIDLTYFASAQAPQGGIFEALGIDWQMLIFQIIAFLLLVWLLGKFVYPPLMRVVDARQEKIEEGLKAAEKAKQDAKHSEDEIRTLLETAKRDAQEIISTAKDEASALIGDADKKASARAQAIVDSAHTEIDKDIEKARTALRSEMIDLVALATGTVLKKKIDAKADEKLISDALEGSK